MTSSFNKGRLVRARPAGLSVNVRLFLASVLAGDGGGPSQRRLTRGLRLAAANRKESRYMSINRLTLRAAKVLELWHADGWLTNTVDYALDGIAEPKSSAKKVHTFASTSSFSWDMDLDRLIVLAGRTYGPGEVMVLDEGGRRVAGPYTVLGVRTRAS